MSGEISISYNEAKDFFIAAHGLFKSLKKHWNFRSKRFGFKIAFLIAHTINMFLFYLIGRKILKKPKDALYVVLTYALLPGVNLFAILLAKSVFGVKPWAFD